LTGNSTGTKPAVLVDIGGLRLPVWFASSTKVVLAANYAGTLTGSQPFTILFPAGYQITGSYNAGAWSWAEGASPPAVTAPVERLFTLYPTQSRNFAWNEAFANAALYEWLIRQRKALPGGPG
jgi:hypothetical protein